MLYYLDGCSSHFLPKFSQFFFLCAFALVVLGGGDNVGWKGDPTKPMVFCLQGCSRAGGSAVSPRAISCTAGAWRAKFHSSIDHRADAIHRARPPLLARVVAGSPRRASARARTCSAMARPRKCRPTADKPASLVSY
jgi:hypothetical protein